MTELRRRIGGKSGRNAPPSHDIEEGIDNKSKPLILSPYTFLLLLLALGTAFLLLGVYMNDRLPTSYTKIGNDQNEFVAENALKDLIGLADIGPKVTGSYENEVEAINYLTNKIYDIMKKASPKHNITYDLQKVSGSLALSLVYIKLNLVYNNVQNIIVKIGPKIPADKSLLINCHFDSVNTSPGASDDGLNCAVMLEVLRQLATSDINLPHNIIFLFNGAEENPLLASHGFITQHKWAKELKAFINLESCGAGGREVLFQAGPNHPWLIKTYGKAVQHPSGIVIAEEIFQSGLIPSDTDFRIFRDYGQIPGLDFAHCKNGYVYHTKYDNLKSIENVLGVIKHTGDNVLSLAKAIIFSKEIKNPEEYKRGQQVYFDIFGIFFVNYSDEIGSALCSATVILSIAAFYTITYHEHAIWNVLKIVYRVLMRVALCFGALALALIYNLLTAFTIDYIGYPMSWYTNSIIIVPLYIVPTVMILLISIVTFETWNKSKESIFAKAKMQCFATQLFWTAILFCSTFFKLRSSYLLLLSVLPSTLYTFVSVLLKSTSNRILWPLFYIATTLFTSFYFTYIGIVAFRLFIPITGRSGVERNPEILISLLSTLLSFAVFGYTTALIVAVKKRWIVIKILFGLHLLTLLAIVFSPVGFPFSVQTPQRVSITHVNRQFFNAQNLLKRSDSLFWVQNMEKKGRKVLNILDDAPLLDKFCEKDGFCGLPWHSKFIERSSSTCIASAPHAITDETHLELISKTLLSKNVYRLEFNISGPSHMGLIITLAPNTTIKAWSLPGIPTPVERSYRIVHVHGLHSPLWSLWIEFNVENTENSLAELEAFGLYFHHEKYFSKSFTDFISKFPQWTEVTPALAMYKSYTF